MSGSNKVTAGLTQSGQVRKLAASPNNAIAHQNPFLDLLLSPHPAFIWDHTRHAVTWMNAAARSKFGLAVQDLQAALPNKLMRRFAHCFDGSERKQIASTKLKLPGHPAVDCSLEAIELAGGHRGLVVAEAASAPSKKTIAKLSGKPPPAAKPAKKPAWRPPLMPQLTPEELRAFKAIGRTVRRLAQEKQRASASQRPPAAPIVPLQSSPVQTVPTLLFSAFDLVLFLDKNFGIVGSEGRPQRLGWRKSNLLGKPAAQLLPAKEQAIFGRMTKKLSQAGAQICRDSLVVTGEAGGSLPCRVTLGRWPEGGAQYFLAIISLSLPSRLKQAHFQDSVTHITSLAA